MHGGIPGASGLRHQENLSATISGDYRTMAISAKARAICGCCYRNRTRMRLKREVASRETLIVRQRH